MPRPTLPAVAIALSIHLLAVTITGCAAWRVFREDVAPVACAALDTPFESRACSAHVAAGLNEQDPRASALHAAGQALDALMAGDAGARAADPVALGAAIRAFEKALKDVAQGPLSAIDDDDDEPEPIMPSPTLPLPPPIVVAMVVQ